jgi:hypothetical protein
MPELLLWMHSGIVGLVQGIMLGGGVSMLWPPFVDFVLQKVSVYFEDQSYANMYIRHFFGENIFKNNNIGPCPCLANVEWEDLTRPWNW